MDVKGIQGCMPYNNAVKTDGKAVKKDNSDNKALPADKFTSGEKSGLKEDLTISPKMSSSSSGVWVKDQRPAKLLGRDSDGKVRAGNVRIGFKEASDPDKWQPLFGNVTIDSSALKDVYLVIEPFQPEWIAGHAMLCFEFDKDSPVSTDGGKTTDTRLLVSPEARLKEGQDYSLIEGFKKKFPNVFQLGTWKDSVQARCKRQGHRMMSYKLELDDKQKKELLDNSLAESFKDHSQDFYHTTRNSCFSNCLKLINTVLPQKQKVKEWLIPGMIYSPSAALPITGPEILESKGVLAKSPVVVTLPDEKFAGRKKSKNPLSSFIKNSVKSGNWNLMSGMSGVLLGAGIAAAVSLPGAGIVAAAALGGITGRKAGRKIKLAMNKVFEKAGKYLNN